MVMGHEGELSDLGDSCKWGKPYVLSAVLAILYVSSLYVWKQSSERSTHHSVIYRRFISVSAATVLSFFYVYCWISPSLLKDYSFWALLGFRWDGLINAVVLPILLTAILFLGPIVMDILNHDLNTLGDPAVMMSNMKNILWIRNYIFAPVTEELVFRTCILALIIHCMEPIRAVFVCPLFFGAAHLHHMLEQVRFGTKWKHAILVSSFQFLYTTIFGAYSAYLFLRTGHVLAPILVHSFCNGMGFPDFMSVNIMPRSQRLITITAFLLGLSCWMLLLPILTQPSLYHNNLPWSSRI